MGLIFSEDADRDLEDIGDYIAEDNPHRAVSFVKEIRGVCEGLLEAPLRFAALQGFEAFGYRRRIFGRFAIVYALIGQDVFIVRIVATDMDLGLALSID